jgi:hypothetical protein
MDCNKQWHRHRSNATQSHALGGFLYSSISVPVPAECINAKENWFINSAKFLVRIADHFEAPYLEDPRLPAYLDRLRNILYPSEKIDLRAYRPPRSRGLDKNDNRDGR